MAGDRITGVPENMRRGAHTLGQVGGGAHAAAYQAWVSQFRAVEAIFEQHPGDSAPSSAQQSAAGAMAALLDVLTRALNHSAQIADNLQSQAAANAHKWHKIGDSLVQGTGQRKAAGAMAGRVIK